MTSTAEKADPGLWDRVKKKVIRESKGGKPGQWSARKAQIAVHDYKASGGRYKGRKSADNSLSQWTHEEWGTKSGAKSGDTGERYLPKRARQALTGSEYKRTSDKKRADTRRGRQFSSQPADVARKVARNRDTGTANAGHAAASGLDKLSRAELMQRAKTRGIPGRSRMRKGDLVAALSRGGP